MNTPNGPSAQSAAEPVKGETGDQRPTWAGDFDVREWTRQACEASGVSFAVTDPVALERLRTLVAHPG